MLPEKWMTRNPDRIIYIMDERQEIAYMEALAESATQAVRDRLPKITGSLARSIQPVFGPRFWGVYFPNKISWYLEQGTNAFTMRSLAGKVIPMWVNDPDGKLAKAGGKKVRTRITVDGRAQTLIFRKAALPGTRKTIRRGGQLVSVPRSYPGAPGRIGNPRGAGGRIAVGNTGVRWRHPGITGRQYMNDAMQDTIEMYGLDEAELYLIDAATYPTATKN